MRIDHTRTSCPSQPPGVVRAVLRYDDPAALRLQHQRDEEWFEEKDWRAVRVRPMIEPERAKFQLHVPPGHKCILIIARCSDCPCRYIKPVIVPEEDAAQLLNRGENEFLDWLDESTGRFFQHITAPILGAGGCLRCNSGGGHDRQYPTPTKRGDQ
jgi:hypothetical protein